MKRTIFNDRLLQLADHFEDNAHKPYSPIIGCFPSLNMFDDGTYDAKIIYFFVWPLLKLHEYFPGDWTVDPSDAIPRLKVDKEMDLYNGPALFFGIGNLNEFTHLFGFGDGMQHQEIYGGYLLEPETDLYKFAAHIREFVIAREAFSKIPALDIC